MDKLDLTNDGILGSNIDKIGQLFPNVITETKDSATGKLRKAVDFDLLRQHLSDTLVEGDRERFRLDWPGKKLSILKANTPTTKTLRPVHADSVDFDTTQSIFIEGDNFEVLKVLQESYLGKVKMIYIDPPYNTGKDFIYKDNFAASKGEYEEELGVRDDENGGKLVKNTETNGRYHSDWLSMMQERLIVARDLLTDDGVIFISIDDNEQANLSNLCDEVFSNHNLLANLIWEKVHTRKNSAKYFSTSHEYVLAYAKQKERWDRILLPREGESAYKNPDNHPKGPWKLDPITAHNFYSVDYKITKPNGTILSRPQGRYWRFSEDSIRKKIENNEIVWGAGDSYPMIKRFLSDTQEGLVPITLFSRIFAGDTSSSKKQIDELFGNQSLFDYPKPTLLIRRLMQISTRTSDLILDFFSGSGTTAHAVMQLNAEDGGNRRHIQVQMAEPTDPESEAYKAGYKTIPEISRERIRRAAAKIRTDYAEQIAKRDTPLDTGFRAYKLASSNFTDTRLHPSATTQAALLDATDTIKPGRSAEDILTEVILDLGLTLDMPIEQKTIAGHTAYFVGGNSLVACFDDTVNLDIIDDIAAVRPLLVVFKDASFASDEVRINIDTRIQQLSPDTKVKVL